MCIILEYLPYGDLLGYLRRSRGHEDTYCTGDLRPEEKLTSHDLLKFAWMIADGMSFLAENKVSVKGQVGLSRWPIGLFNTSIHRL